MWPETATRYNPGPPNPREPVSDPTQTATQDLASVHRKAALGLVIVHHADPRFLGSVAHIPARGTLTLGREGQGFSPEALQDPRVSRLHAEIRRVGDTLHLRDLDSRNGTTVNGSPVTETSLIAGDTLALGNVLLLALPLEKERLHTPHPRLVGSSAALGRALNVIERVASHDLPVLVLGETGVGKELLCQEVHAHSGRTGRCVTVNCASLPDHLLQSELFGHVKGAFSGADRPRRGLVEEARGGTLVLDEIGEASVGLQANLLRLLQEREVRAVGSDRTNKVDVRFVTATNRPLAEEVRAGRFRDDLYARLNRCVVRMPPLRERPDDILPLARHFARLRAEREVRLSTALAESLLTCDWPGNARALQSIVERIVIEQGDEEPLTVPSWLNSELQQLARTGESAPPPPTAPRRGRPTREEVEATLQQHNGHITRSAEALGVARNTLYRWVEKWKIDLEQARD